MASSHLPAAQRLLAREQFAVLFESLQKRVDEVIGPVVRDGAAVFGRIRSITDLASGQTVRSGPGNYRLEAGPETGLFPAGPPALGLKPWLHPPDLQLLTAAKENGGTYAIRPDPEKPAAPRYAFLGVRACDLAAVHRLDRVLLGDRYVDPVYAARRRGCLFIAASCTDCLETCYCASMGTGPRPNAGYDLLLDEIPDSRQVLITAGSAAGEELLEDLRDSSAPSMQPPPPSHPMVQIRRVETEGLPQLLFDAFDHPRWESTAARCLACGNCTSACPTCFCVNFEDGSSLDGLTATRTRRWDSCFTQSFTYIHGGSVRLSAKSRLRHRILHKFATWPEQFGEMGCTGCGRCITWCPAGIDGTEEIAALRAAQ
jgi:ferredoxin